MKNEVKWKGYTICRWVAVFWGEEIIGEYDSMPEAKKEWSFKDGITYKYAAAEEINEDGDVNPAVYGDSIKEVMDKLKSVL